jgi:hypothetical protein
MPEQRSTRERIEKTIEEMHEAGCIMTISGVARESGVNNASIHNRYPDLACRIRELAGKVAERDAKQELSKRTGRNKQLQDQLKKRKNEIAELKEMLDKATSVNASLDLENQSLKAKNDSLNKRLGLPLLSNTVGKLDKNYTNS